MFHLRQLLPALRLLVIFTILLGLAYPLALTGVGALLGDRADGQPMKLNGQVVGSRLLCQTTNDPSWFQARPSAVDCDATASGGSNLSPVSDKQLKTIDERRAALKAANPGAGEPPADALTASASGLDPEISPAYARYQVARIAAARGVSPATLTTLIDDHTVHPVLGFIGTTRVNVNDLNLALAKA